MKIQRLKDSVFVGFLLASCLAMYALGASTLIREEETSNIFSESVDVKGEDGGLVGRIRYHLDTEVDKCDSLILLGVGTFMGVEDYDKVSSSIVEDQPAVVIVLDHNPHKPVKIFGEQFALLVNNIHNQLEELIPTCVKPGRILFGGHSASGLAALTAWKDGLLDSINLSGFLGLDPYEIDAQNLGEDFILDLPGLFWGFTKTTCLVKKSHAAAAAYQFTDDENRVLYTIENTGGCKITHCVFSDDGCGIGPISCSTREEFAWIYDQVAKSVHLFLEALEQGTKFTHDLFSLPQEEGPQIHLYVDADTIDPHFFEEDEEDLSAIEE